MVLSNELVNWVHLPSKVSDPLAKFLDVSLGSKLSFQDIMKRTLIYIHDNNLRVPGGFKVNNETADLFGVTVGSTVPYNRLGVYVSKHVEKLTMILVYPFIVIFNVKGI